MTYPSQENRPSSADYSGQMPGQPVAPEPEPEPEKEEGYSHILLLANGDRVNYNSDADPHGPVPTDVNGIPVVSVSPATVGGPA